MPNLSDFLKCEKVRCVSDGYANLNKGSEYNLVRLEVVISNNAGLQGRYPLDDFEPVLETAIQATDSLDDTPMGTRTVNEFEIGNPVYYKNEPKIHIIQGIDENDNAVHFGINGKYGFEWWTAENLVLATPENYEMLCKLYPHIEFEKSPKEITGSDLCRAMLDKGWKYVPCYVSDSNDEYAIYKKDKHIEMIDGISENHSSFFTYCNGKGYIKYAVPFDPRTGSVLTSEVLDD